MIKKLSIAALGAIAATAMIAAPASAAAQKPGQVYNLAKKECKIDRAGEPMEFQAEYGGLDRKALKRCISSSIREAGRDCRSDRREDPREFKREYGGMGDGALKRCRIDELR